MGLYKEPRNASLLVGVEAPSLPNFNLHINYSCIYSSCAVDDRQHIRSPTAYLAEQLRIAAKKAVRP